MKKGDKFKLHTMGAECEVVAIEGNTISFVQPSTGMAGKVDISVIKAVKELN